MLPLIRQLSFRTSPVLARLGLTPNQVTLVGLVAGIASGALFAQGQWTSGAWAGVLWSICYLMDYCDGEVARLTNRSSRFGKYLDDFVDWVVHVALFLGIAAGAYQRFDDEMWLWLGAAAAVGGTLNSAIDTARSWLRERQGVAEPFVAGCSTQPLTAWERMVYLLRVLFKGDFWLVVLLAAFLNITWALLPLLAIGANVFWVVGLGKGANRFVS